jgi:hypothetical protein
MIVTYIGKKPELKLRLPFLDREYNFTSENEYSENFTGDGGMEEWFRSSPKTFQVKQGTIEPIQKEEVKDTEDEPADAVIEEEQNVEPPITEEKPNSELHCVCGFEAKSIAGLHSHQGKCYKAQRGKRK